MDHAQAEAMTAEELETLKYPTGKFVRGTKA